MIFDLLTLLELLSCAGVHPLFGSLSCPIHPENTNPEPANLKLDTVYSVKPNTCVSLVCTVFCREWSFGGFFGGCGKTEPNFSALFGLFLSPLCHSNLWSHLSLHIMPEISGFAIVFCTRPKAGTHTYIFLYFSTSLSEQSSFPRGWVWLDPLVHGLTQFPWLHVHILALRPGDTNNWHH